MPISSITQMGHNKAHKIANIVQRFHYLKHRYQRSYRLLPNNILRIAQLFYHPGHKPANIGKVGTFSTEFTNL